MQENLARLQEEAMCLPASERARLAHTLIASLEAGEDIDAEEAWLAEAERRYQAYREGKTKARSASEVFEQARSKLTKAC